METIWATSHPPHIWYKTVKLCLQLCRMVSAFWEKPTCASPHLPEISPTLPLKQSAAHQVCFVCVCVCVCFLWGSWKVHCDSFRNVLSLMRCVKVALPQYSNGSVNYGLSFLHRSTMHQQSWPLAQKSWPKSQVLLVFSVWIYSYQSSVLLDIDLLRTFPPGHEVNVNCHQNLYKRVKLDGGIIVQSLKNLAFIVSKKKAMLGFCSYLAEQTPFIT